MPPKVKISKEDIIRAAVELASTGGAQAIGARNIAAALNCSTQPIFSNFAAIEEVKVAVLQEAEAMCAEYIKREVASERYPVYKASGMAYIRFAKEQKELFKLLYMRDRTGESTPSEDAFFDDMRALVQSNTGLDRTDAQLFHLEIWAYVHGIAVMFATGFLDLDWELVSKMLTDAYQGLRKQYGMEN